MFVRITILALALAWVLTKEPIQGYSEIGGGMNVRGTFCHYHITNNQITYILLFDSQWSDSNAAIGGFGTGISFEKKDGNRFVMNRGISAISIEGSNFDLRDGVVFLIYDTLVGCGAKQLPIQFERNANSSLDPQIIVADSLETACHQHFELAKFLEQRP